jgi:hypothetical protein
MSRSAMAMGYGSLGGLVDEFYLTSATGFSIGAKNNLQLSAVQTSPQSQEHH